MTSAEQIVSGQISWSILAGLAFKLALVLALIYVSFALLRRYGLHLKGFHASSSPNTYLSELERLPLGQGAQLILVRDPRGGMLLLSMKEGHVRLLERFSSDEKMPSGESAESASESSLLQSLDAARASHTHEFPS